MDAITLYLPITDPTWVFFIVLCIILLAPMIFNRLHIPHLVGMILAGALIGENGLDLLDRDGSFELFGKVGIYYIMFLAGLEMDLEGLKKNQTRGLIFGALTTAIPFLFGFISGYWVLGFSMPASMLLACILASHTLVAYPIVGRYGLGKHPSVTVSIAATMFALLSALLILASISGTFKGGNDAIYWSMFAVKCIIYFVCIFTICPRIIRAFFRKYSDNVMQYIFVIAVVFFFAAMAELCGLEGILGAFLSGLVLNRFIPRTSPLMNRVEFVGNALFIPYFLIGVGMLVNVKPLFAEEGALVVVAVMVIDGTLSKLLAAHITRKLFKMDPSSGLMMFGLTEAHAAGALAMVMVGTGLEIRPGEPLMNNAVLDGVVMMILISCIISSIATDQAARNLTLRGLDETASEKDYSDDSEKIMIPVSYHDNIESIVGLAIMMRNQKRNSELIAINVVYDDEHSEAMHEHSRKILTRAEQVAASADVKMVTQSRLATNPTSGLVHAVRENDATELIIGLHHRRSIVDSYLGSFTTELIGALSRQIIIVKSIVPLNTIRRIVVAVPERAEFETGFVRWVERLSRLADEIGCQIVFHATERTSALIMSRVRHSHPNLRASYELLDSWDDLLLLSEDMNYDHMFVVVTARTGSISYQKSFEQLPKLLERYFSNNSLMIVYPDQFGEEPDNLTFAEPRGKTTANISRMSRWMSKWISKIG